jgi:hypothetical protein
MVPILSPPTLPAAPPRDATNIPSIFSAGEYSTLDPTWHKSILCSCPSLGLSDPFTVWSSRCFPKIHPAVIMACWCTHEYDNVNMCSNSKFLQPCCFRFLAELSSACPFTYILFYSSVFVNKRIFQSNNMKSHIQKFKNMLLIYLSTSNIASYISLAYKYSINDITSIYNFLIKYLF